MGQGYWVIEIESNPSVNAIKIATCHTQELTQDTCYLVALHIIKQAPQIGVDDDDDEPGLSYAIERLQAHHRVYERTQENGFSFCKHYRLLQLS